MNTAATTPPQPGKLALSRREAAVHLGVSLASLDRLTRRGLVKPSRALRRPLYTVEELRRFLAETRVDLDAA